jgi:hypothetical protein
MLVAYIYIVYFTPKSAPKPSKIEDFDPKTMVSIGNHGFGAVPSSFLQKPSSFARFRQNTPQISRFSTLYIETPSK